MISMHVFRRHCVIDDDMRVLLLRNVSVRYYLVKIDFKD